MAKSIVGKWRESASLIVLAKNACYRANSGFDYNVLLLNRPQRSSFMPNSWVFPGGVCEQSDASAKWLKYFQSFGITTNQLQKLAAVTGDRANIFNKSPDEFLPKEISLRISAIRETFEEVGIFLCRKRNAIDVAGSDYGMHLNNFDHAHWQHLIHADHTKFLTLCEEMDVIPDIWSLYEWSAWLTPATLKKRFETAFFAVALEDEPKIVVEPNEVAAYAWKSPAAYLEAAQKKDIWLPPPQYYELSRLLHFKQLAKAKDFASARSTQGSVLMLPVLYKCNDGNVHVLPGDDAYPSDPNESEDFIITNQTIAEFRKAAKKLHRSEHATNAKVVLQLNFTLPNGHLTPITASAREQ